MAFHSPPNIPADTTSTPPPSPAPPSHYVLSTTKTLPISIIKKHNRPNFKVSCKAMDSDDQNSSTTTSSGSKIEETSQGKLDRRSVVIGIGAASLGGTTRLASTVPTSSPDLSNSTTTTTTTTFPIKLDKIVRITVPRPRKSRSKREIEEHEEILVIDGIEVDKNAFVKFDVYVNDDADEGQIGPDNTEFAGSYVNVPHKMRQGQMKKSCLRLALSELLEDLGAEDDDNVLVSLVPKFGSDIELTIDAIKIEFD